MYPVSAAIKTQEAFLNLPIHKFITESRPLKSVAQEKWGTHDALWVQWSGNEVAKAHRQLRSPKIWIDKFPNRSCKILLCVCLETMETQLEQLVLFESDKMKWNGVMIKLSWNWTCTYVEQEFTTYTKLFEK